jgi:hypothetical protein
MNLRLDQYGDLAFTDGNIALATGIEEVAQKLKVRYSFFLGEWYLDKRLGVPWIQSIFVKGTPENLIRSKLMRVALRCPGVSSVEDFQLVLDNSRRQLALSFQARLDSGARLRFAEEFII